MAIPPPPVPYGSRDYWDSRYGLDPHPFDWYARFEHPPLKSLLLQTMRPSDRTLIVGCGSSRMAEELWEADFRAVHNIDFSSVAISLASNRLAQAGLKAVQNSVMDARTLGFDDATFDAVVDKATLDSMFCGEGGAESVDRMLAEISRVLKDGGSYLLFSSAPPEQRLQMLERPGCAPLARLVRKPSARPSRRPPPVPAPPAPRRPEPCPQVCVEGAGAPRAQAGQPGQLGGAGLDQRQPVLPLRDDQGLLTVLNSTFACLHAFFKNVFTTRLF